MMALISIFFIFYCTLSDNEMRSKTDTLLVKSTPEAQYWNGVRLVSLSNQEDNISISSKVIN